MPLDDKGGQTIAPTDIEAFHTMQYTDVLYCKQQKLRKRILKLRSFRRESFLLLYNVNPLSNGSTFNTDEAKP